MNDRPPLFEEPFDSDDASDAIAELEGEEDVAAAMAEALDTFVRDNEEYVEEGAVEEALAFACLVAARISGIAPDESAHHWLDRNPFTVSGDLRRLAAAAFALATRPRDNWFNEVQADWQGLLEHLEPYRKALHGEPQEAPAPFVPDLSRQKGQWLRAFWSIAERSLPDDTPYADAAERLVLAVNEAPDWLAWWRPANLQELLVFGQLTPGAYTERISRGRATAEAWIDFGHSHEVSDLTQVIDDLQRALTAAGRHLGLDPVPALPALPG
ncbi:DUF4259 domain-containing protein [Streptosporangium amethystogenes]|uniref:DUF4259 domain-containing protein n=1 Tax=Streptosporangium amethystogenes TaxID=2002 RepID=UPI00147067D9|nr:DUF4259 domain-containing protein [Streptosporangium amethystogenes]